MANKFWSNTCFTQKYEEKCEDLIVTVLFGLFASVCSYFLQNIVGHRVCKIYVAMLKIHFIYIEFDR